MGSTEKRIEMLGLELPTKLNRGSGVVDARLQGDMLYLSAHLPLDEAGKPMYVGKVGAEIDLETAYKAARLCGLNMLSTIKDYIGDLDRIDYIVKALGLVNSAGDFSSQPAVMNGFSDLMVEVLGRRGQHARSAMGAFALPLNVPIVVDAIVKIRD
ncbi:MAG: RidA family protein [Clostridia bacterium]|jgi:enamine deaminase RidA (YjgF/YER057c/UK114 family)|nr:RidA family protein [Clostridia bacterium]